MMRKSPCKKLISLIMPIIVSVCFLCACKGMELENKTEQVEEYTKEQAMIIVANERNRYENLYSSDIWKLRAGNSETGFDRLLVQNVREYLEKIKLLDMLAEEEGIQLSNSERETVRLMTEQYMSALSAADIDYIGLDEADCQMVYTDIYTADKFLTGIMDQVDSEISDSEAKVIKVQQIVTEDEKKAKAILKRVKIDGANFASMASRYTESDIIELELLNNGDDMGLIPRTAFSMEEGEISNILCSDGLYYIIKVTDAYDEEATKSRKEMLIEAMNNKAVLDIIEPYEAEHNIRFFSKFWNEISFDEESGSTVTSFFDIYNSVMGY